MHIDDKERQMLETATDLEAREGPRAAVSFLMSLGQRDQVTGRVQLRTAMLLDGLSREKTAIGYYRSALDSGDLTRKEREQAMIFLASSYRNIKQFSNALQVLQVAEEFHTPVVACLRGLVLLDLGDAKRAVQVIGNALLHAAEEGGIEGYEGMLRSKFMGVVHRKNPLDEAICRAIAANRTASDTTSLSERS